MNFQPNKSNNYNNIFLSFSLLPPKIATSIDGSLAFETPVFLPLLLCCCQKREGRCRKGNPHFSSHPFESRNLPTDLVTMDLTMRKPLQWITQSGCGEEGEGFRTRERSRVRVGQGIVERGVQKAPGQTVECTERMPHVCNALCIEQRRNLPRLTPRCASKTPF